MTNFQKSLNPKKEWICFYCIDFLDESKRTHRNKQEESLSFAKYTRAQIMIAKYWRRFVALKFYVRIYNLIVFLQVRFRVNQRKKSFHKQVQGKLRPFHLRISRCSYMNLDLSDRKTGKQRRDSLPATGNTNNSGTVTTSNEPHFVYVIATVLDFTKGQLNQTWRIVTDLVSVAPQSGHSRRRRHSAGGSSNSTDNINADNSNTDNTDPSNTDKSINESMKDPVPEPVSSQQPSPQPPRPKQYHYYNTHPQPKHLYFDCSLLLGGVSGYQIVVLSVYQRGSCSRDLLLGQTYVDLSQGMLWKRGGSFSRKLEAQDFAVKDQMGMDMKTECRAAPQGSIDFELSPVQGLCTACGTVLAPVAEDLIRIVSLQQRFPGFVLPKLAGGGLERRKYAVGMQGSGYGSTVSLHRRKSWVALADGRIYMYSHFGDSLKLRINVEFFSFYATIRDRAVVYILRSPDFPDLEFSTYNKEEELRWKCAFLSSFRSKIPISLSAHLAPDSPREGDAGTTNTGGSHRGYDFHTLIRDLALLEVSRYAGKESIMMLFYTPTAMVASSHTPTPTEGSSSALRTTSATDCATAGNSHHSSSSVPMLPPVKVFKEDDKKHTARASTAVGGAHGLPPVGLKPRISFLDNPHPLIPAKSSASIGSLASQSSSYWTDTEGSDTARTYASDLGHTGSAKLPAPPSTTPADTSHNTEGPLKNLFDEIDREIAHIQDVKNKYKKEYRDDRLHQQQQMQAIAAMRSGHHTHRRRQHRPRPSLTAHHMLSKHRSEGETDGAHAGLEGPPPSLQSIREAVSEAYAVEESTMSEQLNTVGAEFVARILTTMRQKKVTPT